jgi:hypothetical protein
MTMCGRFTLSTSPKDIARTFDLYQTPDLAPVQHRARPAGRRRRAEAGREDPMSFESHRLLGSYKSPRFRHGDRVRCEVRGELVVVGLSDAPIPWPVGLRGRAKSLVIYQGLAEAVRRESSAAVCHHWGVTGKTVSTWRRALGVGPLTEGTSRLKSEALRESEALAAAVARGRPAADEAERRRKIGAALRGRTPPKHVLDALRASNVGRTMSEETRRRMSAAKKGKPRPRRPWADWELALLGTLADAEVAKRTGRSEASVEGRRRKLGRERADR